MATMSPGEYSGTKNESRERGESAEKGIARTSDEPPWWASNDAKIGYAVTVLGALATLLFINMQFSEDLGSLKAQVAASEQLIDEHKADSQREFDKVDDGIKGVSNKLEKLDDKIEKLGEKIDRKHDAIMARLPIRK